MGKISQNSADPKNSPRPRLFVVFKLELLEHITAVFGLLTVLGILRYLSLAKIFTHYLGGFEGDAGLYSWLINLNARDLLNPWFDTYAFYPYGYSLAWSDNFILPSLIGRILFNLGLGQPLTYNLIILGAEFLSGYLCFLLFYKLTGELLNALSVGTVILGLGYFTFQLGHPQLQFFFWIPLTLLCLVYYLNSTRIFWAGLLGLTICGSFLTTVYYSIFSVVAAAAFFGAVVCLRPRALLVKDYFKFTLGALAGFCPCILFILPYLEVKSVFGSRGIYEAYNFAATPFSYLSASPYSMLYDATSSLSHSEAHLFCGFVLLALAAMAFVRLGESKKLRPRFNAFAGCFLLIFAIMLLSPDPLGRFIVALLLWLLLILFVRLIYLMGYLERQLKFSEMTARDLIAIFSAIAVVFFVISLGPLGNPEKGQSALAPYRLLFELMPGFNSVRAISRAGIITIFALTFLFGLDLSNLQNKRNLGSAVLLPTLFILIENFAAKYPLDSATPPPVAIQQLATLEPRNGAVIVLPFAGSLDRNGEVESWSQFARLNVKYLHWLFPLKIKTLNGYSGQRTKLMKELPRELRGFPSQRAIQALARIGGTRYVVYIPSLDLNFDPSEFTAKLKEVSGQLKLIGRYDDGSMLFEINSELEANEDLFIWLPSFHETHITFEARAEKSPERERAISEVYMKDEFDLRQLNNIELAADGKWHEMSLVIPESQSKVRPAQLTFAPRQGAALSIKNIRIGSDH